MPEAWHFKKEGAFYLWRSPDQSQSAFLAEFVRNPSRKFSLKNYRFEKFQFLEERRAALESIGFRAISIDSANVTAFHERGAVLEIKFRFLSPGGVWLKAHEKLYSTETRVRITSVTSPLESEAPRKSDDLLARMAPKWASRSIASVESKENELEASVCCTNEPKIEGATELKPISIPYDPTKSANAQKACEGIPASDLQSSKAPGLDLESFYNESTVATPIGCAQGVYESAALMLSGLGGAAKGLWNLTDSNYREELAATIGYGVSALWNDPIGVGKKVVHSVMAELAKSWNALPCLNRRAATRAVCEAATSIIVGGYVAKVLKSGLQVATAESKELSKTLKDIVTRKKPLSEVLAKPSSKSTPPSTAAVVSETKNSKLAEAISRADSKDLPIQESLAQSVEEAAKIGELNEDLIKSRLEKLSSKGTREEAYQELRRINFVISAILREDGDTLAAKVDKYLSKHVNNLSERELMRSCILKVPPSFR